MERSIFVIYILKREFIDSFKSVRSILILLFITLISYQSANFVQNNPAILELINGESIGISEKQLYTGAISFIFLLFGFLFVFAVSHDLINKEIELKTIRLLVTKTSRIEIILGKFFGTLLFWIVILSLSFAILTIIAGDWFPRDYFTLLSYLFYMVGFVLLISTVVVRTKLSMFLGIILGIIFPIIGLSAMESEKWYLQGMSYMLPYRYLDGSINLMFIPFILGLIFIGISIIILNRRDL